MASMLSNVWRGSTGSGSTQGAMPATQDLIDPQQIALFDALKELSRLKVSSSIEVPQLIVVGDQSSGKSSVLEAIGRFHFPVDDSLCTLFPTRLILRRSPDEHIKLWIEPAASRSKSDRHRLSQFQRTLSGPEDFQKEMREVAIELGAVPDSLPSGYMDHQARPRKFKDDILVVESSGPTLSHVDLIDLPGLWLNDSTEQDTLSRRFVQSMVENYIRSKRSLVLLVISARANFHNQAGVKTIQRISETDPDLADRLVGVMTSPDQALSFKDSISLLNGSVALTNLRHEWLVVKNQDQKERRNETLADRDRREENFFRTDQDWKAVPEGQWGIDSLKRVLRAAFFKHTQAYLPRLTSEIEDKVSTINARLKSSGPTRSTDEARRRYLYDIARKFEYLTSQACLGTYQDEKCKNEHSVGTDCSVCKRFFAPFGDVPSEGHVHNLRANIRGLHKAFALAMRDFGKTMEVDDKNANSNGDSNQDSQTRETKVGGGGGQSTEDCSDTKQNTKGRTYTQSGGGGSIQSHRISKYYTHQRPEAITRQALDQWVMERIPVWSAREPQGEASEAVYHGFFEYQSRKWRRISESHLEAVWEAVRTFVDAALAAACPDDEVREGLRAYYTEPGLTKLYNRSQRALNDLLSCHAGGNTGFYDGFMDVGPLRRRMTRVAQKLSKSAAEDVQTTATTTTGEQSSESGGHDLFEFFLKGAKAVTRVQTGGSTLAHELIGEILFGNVGGILADAFNSDPDEQHTDPKSATRARNAGRTWFGLVPGELRGASAARVIENNEMFYEMSMMSFVGYVNSLVVENGVLNELSVATLTGRDVIHADAAVVGKIAGENVSRARKRKQDEYDLKVLEAVLETLRSFSSRV